MASAFHRHQSSLEEVIDFSPPQSLTPDEFGRATRAFNQIIRHHERVQNQNAPYKQITLIRCTHDYAPSRESVLRHFFLYMESDLRSGDILSQLEISQALSRSAFLTIQFNSILAQN